MSNLMQVMFVAWAAVVLFVWAFASLGASPPTLAEIPASVVTLLGLLLTGQVSQTVALAMVARRQHMDSLPKGKSE